MVKRLAYSAETWAQSLGWEDPLEKEMAPHSSTLAWKIPWTEEPGGLQSTGREESDPTKRLHFHFSPFCLFILLIFESLVLKLQLKISTYPLKK